MRAQISCRRGVGVRALQALAVVALLMLFEFSARAQDFDFRPPATLDAATTPAVMRDLAERILPVYQENDPLRYMRNLSALQAVAGDWPAADSTRQSLRDRRRSTASVRRDGRAVLFDIYTHARAMQASNRVPLAQAFTQAYTDTLSRLNNWESYAVTEWRGPPVALLEAQLQKSLDRWRTKGSIPLADAVELVWSYFSFIAYRDFAPLIGPLDADDDRRRYITDGDVIIKTSRGVSIHAVLVRPNNALKPLPTLLEFTIDATSKNYAHECAAHGYVGVVAYTRGTDQKRTRVEPYEHDGEDARAVINWIAKQSWSDGRVGMYGSSYSGFTQWAAAKRLPAALKAIATSDATAPGIDAPIEQGNIFRNSGYRWAMAMTPQRSTGTRISDIRWHTLDETWYKSGKPYQELDRIFGKPNRFFHRWINHPSYDRFWQKMIPYRQQFSHINIPVLATSGYYGDGEVGALYYFTQQYRYDPDANQTLLIGPYDDAAINQGPAATMQGYAIDSTALVDLHELRYQWFDYVLRGGGKPPLLADRVNFEVMGANEWRHVPSLDAMANGSLRFYLDAKQSGSGYGLTQAKASTTSYVAQKVSLTDRSDASWTPATAIVDKQLKTHYGLTFVSDPLSQPLEINGLFSGRLDFRPNKMDMDLNISLYELLPSGEYVQLFAPAYEFRASYARDRAHRHLLKAGERQQLTFKSERMTSRKLQVGSRVVMVLSVNKRPDQEINYGTGDNVSEDSIADGEIPLKVRWYNDSYVDLPVKR